MAMTFFLDTQKSAEDQGLVCHQELSPSPPMARGQVSKMAAMDGSKALGDVQDGVLVAHQVKRGIQRSGLTQLSRS